LAKQKELEKRTEKFEKLRKSEKVDQLEAQMMSKICVGLDSIALNDKYREAVYGMEVSVSKLLFYGMVPVVASVLSFLSHLSTFICLVCTHSYAVC